jgi:hypothetical protein
MIDVPAVAALREMSLVGCFEKTTNDTAFRGTDGFLQEDKNGKV